MRQKIFQLFITLVLGIVTGLAQAQIIRVMDTIKVDENSAFAGSYRERIVSYKVYSKEELEGALDKLWSEYAFRLKIVLEERDDSKATELLIKTKYDLDPPLDKIINNIKIWRKAHTKAEVKSMVEWCNANDNKKELQLLQTNPDLYIRAEKSKEFNKAYVNIIKAITKVS